MKIKKLFISVLSLYITVFSQWNIDTIGLDILSESGYPFDVAVGNGRDDGVNRLYVSCKNGILTEFTYNLGQWNSIEIVPYVQNLGLLTIGDGRGDGSSHVYWSEFIGLVGRIYEASWNGNSWDIDTVDINMQSLSIFIGPGRNDGRNRLYAGTFGAKQGLWEYTYNNGIWEALKITTTGMEGSGAIGDLRNDGVMRILSNANNLQELTWDGSSYKSQYIKNSNIWPDPTEIGIGRNDGNVRVYVNCSQGRTEFSYNNGNWVENIIDNTQQRGDVYLARLKNDGQYRLYSTFSNTPVRSIREYEWSGNSFSQDGITLDALTGATAQLTSGDGRNDGVERLYAPNWSGGFVYEVTAADPWIDTAATLITKFDKINQTFDMNIDFHGKTNVEIFTFSGRLITEKIINANGKINVNEIFSDLSAGSYLFRAVQGKNKYLKRIVKR